MQEHVRNILPIMAADPDHNKEMNTYESCHLDSSLCFGRLETVLLV